MLNQIVNNFVKRFVHQSKRFVHQSKRFVHQSKRFVHQSNGSIYLSGKRRPVILISNLNT